MDEAEKYKQRLEAIAEKRRLQEEQEKARREMEDEKLRLQQLKRKSLRDKWLMEGPPLSPTSSNSLGSNSPSWSTHEQDMEKHTDDKLPSESELMAEEQEKPKEDDQQEAVKVAEPEAGITQDGLQNGENAETRSETHDSEGKVNQNPPAVKTTVVLTNGNHSTNGPITATEVSGTSESDVTEDESGRVPSDAIHDEEEEGTLVMRAECVIVTDEGDDAAEEFSSQQDQQESLQSDKTLLPHPETGKETEDAVEEEAQAEAAPETLTEMGKSAAAEEGDTKSSSAAADGRDGNSEDPNSVQSPAEGAAVAVVQVYTEAPPSSGSPPVEAEATASSEGAEAELKVEEPTRLPEQFQEVPLTDPQDQQTTAEGPGEQEPLLQKAAASNTKAESANSPASTKAQNPSRPGPGGDSESPKHKSCQCCSVM